MESNFLESAIRQFEFDKLLAKKTFDQLSDEQFFWQFNEESNSVATIVKHMSGNMVSRWTDFLKSDGEKEWRNREAEFDNDITSRETMLQIWKSGWDCVFGTLRSLQPEDLSKTVYIRNMGHTVVDAITRQMAHYPYHIGQIIYIGKMAAGKDWKSLSIPRGGSANYNADKFAKPRRMEHFTDEILKKTDSDKHPLI